MDKDLAWPVAALWTAALAGFAGAATAGQWLSAWLVLGLSAAASVLMGLAWRRVRRRVDLASAQLRSLSQEGAAAEPEASGSAEESLGRLDEAGEQLRSRIDRQMKDLAKKTRNLEALIDGLDEPVVATGSQETIVLCNRAAEELAGIAPGGLAGRRFREVFTRPEVLSMHAAARAGQSRREQVRLTTPAGVRTFEASATPLPAAWGEGIYGAVLFLRDVTSLAQSAQMRTDFVANASHELRTPVAAIRIAAETLQDGAKEDPVMRDRMLAMIVSHAERLEEMTSELMDLSRLQSPEMPVNPAPVNTEDLAATLRSVFEGKCRERGLSLEFRIDPSLAVFETDPKLLSLILRNLVDNATKYANKATAIRISVMPGQGGEGHAEGVRWVRLTVSDEGLGIPLAHQERVFERFYQVDEARTGPTSKRGAGLGLAIVKHAAKALGGRVGLESTWGKGTSVWVEIPAAGSEPA